MRLVKESLHDVMRNVWNSHISAVEIVFQIPRGKKVRGQPEVAHLLSAEAWLSVLAGFSTPNKKNSYFFIWGCRADVIVRPSLNTHLAETTPPENIKPFSKHARLHVDKRQSLAGKKKAPLHCVSVCTAEGGNPPTKPH